MRAIPVLLALAAATGSAQQAEKVRLLSISGPDLRDGIISEITWDGGALLIQGVFAQADGALQAQYFVVPTDRVTLMRREDQTEASIEYWRRKANRVSPTGLGRISSKSDTQMPQFGVGSLERRIADAVDMGGTQTRIILRLGDLIILDRPGPEPYDGETWSWSPLELNKIAYVDGKGDLWTADADGRRAKRILKGSYTLPAWSPDGRAIAIAERIDHRRWDISLVHLR